MLHENCIINDCIADGYNIMRKNDASFVLSWKHTMDTIKGFSSISYFIRMKNLCKASHSFGNQYPAFDHVISLSSLKFRKQQFHRVHELVARKQDQHIHWAVNREYETQTYDLRCFNYNINFRTFM